MKIAVTGTMGSGKSTVSRILAFELGAELINSDEICRLQLQPGQEGANELVKKFGGRFSKADGRIDRELVRKSVFEDEFVKNSLEGILHPIVIRTVNARYLYLSRSGKSLVVEVPLLYETDMAKDFDVSVVVKVPRTLAVKRVYKRDRLELVQINMIMNSQMDIETKVGLADLVIDNSGTMVSTQQQLGWLCKQIKRRSK